MALGGAFGAVTDPGAATSSAGVARALASAPAEAAPHDEHPSQLASTRRDVANIPIRLAAIMGQQSPTAVALAYRRLGGGARREARWGLRYARADMVRERFRRVAQLWNWLPAFRVVAEHEGIHKASAVLATSPSALSRTVKLLEDASGLELFTRRGASLVLTADGSRLLVAVRDAMRLVDDALVSTQDGGHTALRVRVGVSSPSASAVVPLALAPLIANGSARPVVSEVEPGLSVDGLLHGDLDLAVGTSAERSPGIVVERLGAAEIGVYASLEHPLARDGAPPPDGFFAHAFAGRAGDDGWPIERTRDVAATCTSLEAALAFCHDGGLLACLPDVFVAKAPGRRLVRLAAAGPPQVLYAMRREPLEAQDTRVVDAVVSALRACLALG